MPQGLLPASMGGPDLSAPLAAAPGSLAQQDGATQRLLAPGPARARLTPLLSSGPGMAAAAAPEPMRGLHYEPLVAAGRPPQPVQVRCYGARARVLDSVMNSVVYDALARSMMHLEHLSHSAFPECMQAAIRLAVNARALPADRDQLRGRVQVSPRSGAVAHGAGVFLLGHRH
jgi:hypothetical protein